MSTGGMVITADTGGRTATEHVPRH